MFFNHLYKFQISISTKFPNQLFDMPLVKLQYLDLSFVKIPVTSDYIQYKLNVNI